MFMKSVRKLGGNIMSEQLAQSWWVWALRGVAAIIFGLLAIFYPGATLTSLVYVFGAYALVDGAIAVYHAIVNRGTNWGWELLEGVISILAGIAAFAVPFLAFLSLLFVMAFWAIASGVAQIIMAYRLRETIDNEIWLGLAGLLSIIFGVIIFVNPLAGTYATILMIGSYAIVFGVIFIFLAIRYRGLGTTSSDEITDQHRVSDNI
jgi:uncharacterized membrane protein HdeD (DUF308 family)